MTANKNMAPLLGHVERSALFQIHQWNQTAVSLWKPSTEFKIGQFLSRVTLKFHEWPWQTTGHLFYAAWMNDLIYTSLLKLELQSENAKFQ